MPSLTQVFLSNYLKEPQENEQVFVAISTEVSIHHHAIHLRGRVNVLPAFQVENERSSSTKFYLLIK
jgi:hypothetical protein